MKFEHRIELLSKIGIDFINVCNNEMNDPSFPGFKEINDNNPWFTPEFVKFSLLHWGEQLKLDNLTSWLEKYDLNSYGLDNHVLGLIMAGNIPLVGFHDLVCGFAVGLKMNIKFSSKDNVLIKWVVNKFYDYDPHLKNKIICTENRLSGFDVIIATGSNNTNRYFDYYFGSYPHILRKNRNSVAIITGNETKEQLEELGEDIFMYFGLGCRNVSKLYLPENYDFNMMGQAFQKYAYLREHYKYANNFDYQYALIAMNQVERVDFGNLLLVERRDLFSPVAVVNFEYYDDINKVKNSLVANEDNIQCIICEEGMMKNYLKPGFSQKPGIEDYADNIDTIKFLLNLKK